MNMSNRYARRCAFAVALASMVGCGSITMVVPGDVLGASDQILITDRSSMSGALADESFKMGPYDVGEVDRDWNHGSKSQALGFSEEETTGGYSYEVTSKQGKQAGRCLTEAKTKGKSFGSITMSKQMAKLGCMCEGAAEAKVVLQASTTSEYGGTLDTASGSYQIAAIYEREGGLSDGNPSGYRVDGEGPVGAVDVMHPGRVWLGKQVEAAERAQLACIFAGLLLYKPPQE